MGDQGKSFSKVTLEVPVFKNTKGTCFFIFFQDFNF